MSAAQIQDWRDRLAVAAEWRKRGLIVMADSMLRMLEQELTQELNVDRVMGQVKDWAKEPVQE